MEDCRKNIYLTERYRCIPQITNRTWMQIDKNLKGTNFECPTFALYINILNMRTKISTNMMTINKISQLSSVIKLN